MFLNVSKINWILFSDIFDTIMMQFLQPQVLEVEDERVRVLFTIPFEPTFEHIKNKMHVSLVYKLVVSLGVYLNLLNMQIDNFGSEGDL